MTKADQIRQLYAKGLSTRAIAEAVGCGTSYVRVVARQRVPGKNPVEFGDIDAARIASREAYREARKSGLTARQAMGIAGRARTSVLDKTGRAALREVRA